MRSKVTTALALAAALAAAPAMAQQSATATATVKKVDPQKHVVNLSHGAIPAPVNWPAMTMDFAVAPDVNLSSVKPGQEVEFTLAPKAGAQGEYTVTAIKPKG
jgi:Cu/Ag efflux protein CusF